jgi:N-acetylneuraminic acid mutarotase
MTKKFIILFVAAAVLFIGGYAQATSWVYVAPMPAPRAFLAAATGLDGTIYAIGGMYGNDNYHADVNAYDPVANTWTPVASLNYKRALFAAATGQDGKIYAIAGWFQYNPLYSGVPDNRVEVYDPANDEWSEIARMQTKRYHLAAAAVEGKIYVIGGRPYGGDYTYGERRVNIYDPEEGWSYGALMQTGRYGLGVAVVDGKIYAIGGKSNYGPVTNAVEMYDPSTDKWYPKTPMPGPRYRAGVVTGPDGNIYVIGGMSYPGHPVSGVMKYDPRTDTWSGAPGLPICCGLGRADLAAAAGPSAIYAIGGAFTNQVLAYSPVRIVSIDIKPGNDPNSINLGEHGLLPVAILGSADFDVSTIDPTTIEIGGVTLAARGSAKSPKLACSYEDVDLDGNMDMMTFFDVQTLTSDGVLDENTIALTITATLTDGIPIKGTDSVNIVH